MADSYKSYTLPTLSITEESLGENHNLVKIARLIGEDKEVVDFGCATGYLAQLLKRRNCLVTGVDINAEAVEVARQFSERAIVADLDFVSPKKILPSNAFDVAVFGDILEHLRNPWRTLSETRELLKPEGGYVVACIPNVAHGAVRLALLQGRFDYSPIGITDDSHLRFFTRKSSEAMFQRAGFYIESLDRITVPLFSGSPMIPAVKREHFPEQLINYIQNSEESETVQFIIRAFPVESPKIS